MNNKRNSIIILAKNINMDKEYQNIIDYSEADRVSLCESQAHLVAKQTNYSFLRIGENRINVGITYATCLQANYIAMQNPYYSNKWFFAFIDSVEYNSESSTIINYTVDEMATWWGYWTKKICYVEREHVNDDTLGLHTMPEGLETGEYKVMSHLADSYNNQITYVIASTVDPDSLLDITGGVFGGIPSGLRYYRYDTIGLASDTTATTLLGAINRLNNNGQIDAINSIFIAPKWIAGGTSSNIPIDNTNAPQSEDLGISRITTLDTYTPKNNKCLCYPYCYIEISNNVGQATTFKQERWALNSSNEMALRISGCLTPGGSIRCYPINYNGDGVGLDYGITLGKFPSLNWISDHYTNWLTQNGVNIGCIELNAEQAGLISGGLQIGAGVLLGGAGVAGGVGAQSGINTMVSGVGEVLNTMKESYRNALIPNSAKGNLNSGDVTTALGANRIHCYRKTVKREYAESIDAFFTRFGYKVNSLKQPNFTGRTYWNYVKIAGGEIIGYASNNTVNVPESSMDIINRVFRNGTTIWHNHDNIGNYSLNNIIVSNNT